MNDYSITFGVHWVIGIIAAVAGCAACWWLVL